MKNSSNRPLQMYQQGIALPVSLMLLVVITLVGISVVSNTTMQERMTSNMYDRQIAFQSAEAALRVAESRLTAGTATVWRDCSLVTCTSDYTGATWQDVTNGEYDAAGLSAGAAQYVIEDMGNWTDYESSTGFGQSANANQYGAQGVTQLRPFLRITARSHNPAAAGADDQRAVVMLQIWVKQ